MFLKKTIVLSGKGAVGEKAVLTIEKNEEGLFGTVKLYNFPEEPSGILSLGFLPENGKVTKCGLTKKGVMNFSFNLEEDISLSDFSCALIQIDKGKALPILVGSHSSSNEPSIENKLAFSSELLLENASMQKVKTVLDENNIQLEDSEKIEKQIDEEIEKTEKVNPCITCPYRKSFFGEQKTCPAQKQPKVAEYLNSAKPIQNQKTFEKTKVSTASNETVAEKSGLNDALAFESGDDKIEFYQQIQEELEELFVTYPRETILEKIVPFSKWVRVGIDNEDEHYVVGTISEEGKLKYVCYGIPGIFSGKPPKQIERYAQWLPIDANKPNEFGYWMTYQDALSGESIRIVI